jgi:hypothetical protein
MLSEGGEEVWFPKSQIDMPETFSKGDVGTMSVTKWICEKRGIDTD